MARDRGTAWRPLVQPLRRGAPAHQNIVPVRTARLTIRRGTVESRVRSAARTGGIAAPTRSTRADDDRQGWSRCSTNTVPTAGPTGSPSSGTASKCGLDYDELDARGELPRRPVHAAVERESGCSGARPLRRPDAGRPSARHRRGQAVATLAASGGTSRSGSPPCSRVAVVGVLAIGVGSGSGWRPSVSGILAVRAEAGAPPPVATARPTAPTADAGLRPDRRDDPGDGHAASSTATRSPSRSTGRSTGSAIIGVDAPALGRPRPAGRVHGPGGGRREPPTREQRERRPRAGRVRDRPVRPAPPRRLGRPGRHARAGGPRAGQAGVREGRRSPARTRSTPTRLTAAEADAQTAAIGMWSEPQLPLTGSDADPARDRACLGWWGSTRSPSSARPRRSLRGARASTRGDRCGSRDPSVLVRWDLRAAARPGRASSTGASIRRPAGPVSGTIEVKENGRVTGKQSQPIAFSRGRPDDHDDLSDMVVLAPGRPAVLARRCAGDRREDRRLLGCRRGGSRCPRCGVPLLDQPDYCWSCGFYVGDRWRSDAADGGRRPRSRGSSAPTTVRPAQPVDAGPRRDRAAPSARDHGPHEPVDRPTRRGRRGRHRRAACALVVRPERVVDGAGWAGVGGRLGVGSGSVPTVASAPTAASALSEASASAPSEVSAPTGPMTKAKVTRVVDGDTIIVAFGGSTSTGAVHRDGHARVGQAGYARAADGGGGRRREPRPRRRTPGPARARRVGHRPVRPAAARCLGRARRRPGPRRARAGPRAATPRWRPSRPTCKYVDELLAAQRQARDAGLGTLGDELTLGPVRARTGTRLPHWSD